MADVRTLNLLERNDMVVELRVTRAALPEPITGHTLEMYVKPFAETDDTDDSVTKLTSVTGEITITDAAGGVARAVLSADVLAAPGSKFWRLDVLDPGGRRRTAMYGPLNLTNL